MASFCLIHGQWHDGSCWTPVVERLAAYGHSAVAPDMPFDDPRADYARRAQPALEALAGVEPPVVVVGHSIASAEAALVASECSPALLVHLCPRFGTFPAPPEAPPAFRTGFPFPRRDNEDRRVWDADAAIRVMYPRLPDPVAREQAARLRPGASAAGPYPLARHPTVATALVYTTDDEFFTPEWERFVAKQLLGVVPVELPGGHFPMLEWPDALTVVLVLLAVRATGPASA